MQRNNDKAFTSGMDPGPAEPGVTCARGGCYAYFGCYKDNSSRVIPTKLSKDNVAVTVDGCAAVALAAGYRCVPSQYFHQAGWGFTFSLSPIAPFHAVCLAWRLALNAGPATTWSRPSPRVSGRAEAAPTLALGSAAGAGESVFTSLSACDSRTPRSLVLRRGTPTGNRVQKKRRAASRVTPLSRFKVHPGGPLCGPQLHVVYRSETFQGKGQGAPAAVDNLLPHAPSSRLFGLQARALWP